ncbi:MAG TPA: sulfatase, partial [Verrucomicrobiales bacterium]|nr:sulfatase [Verrucomicrobiales bacterium]
PAWLEKTQSWKMGPDGKIVGAKGKGGTTFQKFVQQSNDCVEALDEGVGRLITALKESGQIENTLVVFTADQGFALGEHGLRIKLAPYDAAVRSPFIISMPGRLAQGKVCAQPVNSPDLVRTFFSFAGLEPEWEMHGRDLTPLLTAPDAPAAITPCLYEHTGKYYGSEVAKVLRATPAEAEHGGVPWYVALNDGRWKYIRYLRAGEIEELYDLKDDPEELANLAASAAHRPELERLRAALATELDRTRAPFTGDLNLAR